MRYVYMIFHPTKDHCNIFISCWGNKRNAIAQAKRLVRFSEKGLYVTKQPINYSMHHSVVVWDSSKDL